MRKIVLSVKSKILLTVLFVVMLFALFILFYFPARQERYLLENYNDEIENFAKTVALGVKIAITEQNFEGVETAIDFVRNDSRLRYVSLVQSDTIWEADGINYEIGKAVFKTFPDSVVIDAMAVSNDFYIIKSAAFSTPIMSGEIILSFSTDEIVESRRQIRMTSLIASLIVFIIGLLIGYWLARNISIPVLALRDAANKVGEGDLTQSVRNRSRDEIGELSVAFNKMVKDLSIEAALERVRSEIASMRSKEDLPRVTPLIWKELTSLGVPFIRCGVFIVDEGLEVIQSYLSTPDGQSLGVFNMPYNGDDIASKLYDHWIKELVYTEQWGKEQFLNWMQNLIDQGHIKDFSTYQGATAPPESLDLHFVPFKQGMLYVGNKSVLSEDDILLVKSLAEAFSVAYTRYEDFKKLEDANNQMEITLSELKATQTQLIQSEKMASLGELTAGIAHEIQNPLNFVINFSEVNGELIDELRGERMESLEEDILSDISQNLEKIYHHGKRADAIVKGMLQHSQTSNEQKVATDINALADEYLRLAYHGLRAKDKSFNSIMKTDFDEKIGSIKIIPQDIGRVILNLITNAFYAVNAKKQEIGDSFEPVVSIITKKIDGKVEIKVVDNGEGIPEQVLDKIFQPFFTTKPTGQGTGLGLSIAYDIITNAHGGKFKVQSKEGEGTEMLIIIPVDSN